MKRVISGLLLFAMLIPSGSAFAQADGDTPAQFIPFDPLAIEGNRKASAELIKAGPQRADFNRLARVKKSFMTQVQESASEPSLH